MGDRGLWGGGLPHPAGRKPYGRGAARRSARPHPQAGGAGPNAPPVTAPAYLTGPSSSRRASCRRAKITIKVVRPRYAAGAPP